MHGIQRADSSRNMNYQMGGKRITMLSAGQGSFRVAAIDRKRHPDAEFAFLFTDTLYEDADAYRFLIEGAAQLAGRQINWTVDVNAAPDYRVDPETPLDEYRGNAEWRAWLADLRARAADAIPELIWLTDGRDPWEVFRDKRFLGNSSVDPCSLLLKREIADDWRMGNCHRIGELFGPPDVFLVGIGDHESHRFDDLKGGGLGPRMAAHGWVYEAPLLSEPMKGEHSLFFSPIEQIGPAAPRLYGLGYMHNNCGGFCCKAGQAHWRNRLIVQPERYAYDKLMDGKLRAYLGGDYAMMTDRRGGDKKPMTLEDFETRLIADPAFNKAASEWLPGDSGCGCMGG